jgi:hypothetical protein
VNFKGPSLTELLLSGSCFTCFIVATIEPRSIVQYISTAQESVVLYCIERTCPLVENKFDTRMGDNASDAGMANMDSTWRSTNGLGSFPRRCLNLGNSFRASLSTCLHLVFANFPLSIRVTPLIVLVVIIILFCTDVGESIRGLITRLSQLLGLFISAIAFVLEKTQSVSELAAQSFPRLAHLNCIFVDCTETNFLRDTKNEIREAASLVSSVPALHHYPHVLVQYSVILPRFDFVNVIGASTKSRE